MVTVPELTERKHSSTYEHLHHFGVYTIALVANKDFKKKSQQENDNSISSKQFGRESITRKHLPTMLVQLPFSFLAEFADDISQDLPHR